MNNLHEIAQGMNMAVGDLVRQTLMKNNVKLLQLTDDERERIAAEVYGQTMTHEQVAEVVRSATGRNVSIVQSMGRTWVKAELYD